MPCFWGPTWGTTKVGKEAEEAGKPWARAFIMVPMGRSRQI